MGRATHGTARASGRASGHVLEHRLRRRALGARAGGSPMRRDPRRTASAPARHRPCPPLPPSTRRGPGKLRPTQVTASRSRAMQGSNSCPSSCRASEARTPRDVFSLAARPNTCARSPRKNQPNSSWSAPRATPRPAWCSWAACRSPRCARPPAASRSFRRRRRSSRSERLRLDRSSAESVMPTMPSPYESRLGWRANSSSCRYMSSRKTTTKWPALP
jgi:hypothetical protein